MSATKTTKPAAKKVAAKKAVAKKAAVKKTVAKKPVAKKAAAKPWDKENPKGSTHEALSPAAKASAKRHAKAAGRPYPNLVDNMHAAAAAKKNKT